MAMILALNGVPMDDLGEFGEFGAASVSVAGLQTALASFGRQIGDAILKAIVVDGLIGPKTVAAANRALRTHIGPNQVPAELRTGLLKQAQVVAAASQIAQLLNTEARRRGFGTAAVPTTVAKKKVVVKKAVAKAPVQSTALTYIPPSTNAPGAQSYPAYGPPLPPNYTPAGFPAQVAVPTSRTYVVPASSGGMDIESTVKWAAIGFGVVVLLGGAYYYVNRRRGSQPVMAGFGAFGPNNFYHTSSSEFRKGMRVQLHPGTDLWMRGDRYGTVTRIMKRSVHVKTDHGNRTSVSPSRLEIVE